MLNILIISAGQRLCFIYELFRFYWMQHNLAHNRIGKLVNQSCEYGTASS